MTDDAPRVRVRGVYATALTQLLSATDASDGDPAPTVTRPSDPIRRRFEGSFPAQPPSVQVETSDDRTGVSVSGDPDAVPRVTAPLSGVAADTLVVEEPAPRLAVFEATVDRTLGGGAVLDLGERDGYLPFDAADGYVEAGDRLRVQVQDPVAPWSDRRPGLGVEIRAGGPLVELVRGAGGVDAAVPEDRAAELARTTELLSTAAPDGWGIEWRYPALDASVGAMDAALEAATAQAEAIDAALAEATPGDATGPARLAAPETCRWVWFGREARFALDEHRRAVTETMAGHHRVKAGGGSASDAVDFLERVCGSVGVEDGDAGQGASEDTGFPFDAVTGQFGPREGDDVRIAHGKPDGRLIELGWAEVTERDPDGRVVLERELSSSGEYDGLGTQRRPGDVAMTRVREGRWWYPTAYRGAEGERKGTYVNVCTPVEVFPDAVRYVDLHVDVVRLPDGTVRRVDEDELSAAVERGELSERLAERARSVAATVERALG